MPTLGLGLGLKATRAGGAIGGGGGPVAGATMAFLQNFSSGSGALSAAEFNAGIHGASWGTWSEAHLGVVGDPNTHTSIVDHDVGLPFNLDVDGVLYDGTEGQGLRFDFTSEPTEYDAYKLAPSVTVTDCVLMSLERNLATLVEGFETTYSNDTYVINGPYSVSQTIKSFAGTLAGLAHSEGSFGMNVALNTGWYLKAMKRDSAAGHTLVFFQEVLPNGSGGWMLGAAGMSRCITTIGTLSDVLVQDYLRPARGTGFVDIKLFAMTEEPDFPPWNPGALSGPSSVSANRTEVEEIELIISAEWALVRIERQVNGGAWATLDAVRDIGLESPVFSYVDTTVTAPNTYRYRVIGLAGDYETAAVQTSIIDLSEPFAEWTDGISLGSAGNSQAFTDSNGFAVGNYVTLPAGTVQKLRLYVEAITGTVSVKMALYAPSGDDALLTTATVDVSSTGFVEFDVPDEVITAGDYLVAFHLDPTAGESITVRYGTGAAGSQRFDTVAYASFPADPHGLLSVGSANYVTGVQVLPP